MLGKSNRAAPEENFGGLALPADITAPQVMRTHPIPNRTPLAENSLQPSKDIMAELAQEATLPAHAPLSPVPSNPRQPPSVVATPAHIPSEEAQPGSSVQYHSPVPVVRDEEPKPPSFGIHHLRFMANVFALVVLILSSTFLVVTFAYSMLAGVP